METAIKKFQKMTKLYPERIFFYRDGLSDTQNLEGLMDIARIQGALKSTGLLNKTSLVYIAVNKRVNTRLFAQGELENSFKNPVPGMVINSGITDKGKDEFYLVSCASRQGMVKPTKYTVMYNSLSAPRENLELLTYKLCHSYFNVASAISVPAPV